MCSKSALERQAPHSSPMLLLGKTSQILHYSQTRGVIPLYPHSYSPHLQMCPSLDHIHVGCWPLSTLLPCSHKRLCGNKLYFDFNEAGYLKHLLFTFDFTLTGKEWMFAYMTSRSYVSPRLISLTPRFLFAIRTKKMN